ncbi:MAG: nucleoside deaminase [Clostridia bacterium]|nr:nucleoside deaminase [Clostridia bacterium]
MREALLEAENAGEDVPVGAVIVKNGVIIARAHNEREGGAQGLFAHAEMLCMQRAAAKLKTKRLEGCTLYVTLEPCPMCAGGMMLSGLSECIFGAFDARQGCCGSVYDLTEDARFYHRVPTSGGLLEDESAALLKRFFENKREKEMI